MSSSSSLETPKTSAFFSSPYSTRPPSPNVPSRSLTTPPSTIPISRLFPSRFNSESERISKPKFILLDTSISLSIPETDNSTPKPPASSPIDFLYSDDILSPGSIIRPSSPPPTPSTPSYEPPSSSYSVSSLSSSRSSYRSLSHDPLLPFPSPIRFSSPSLPASLHHNQIQAQNHSISLKLCTPLGQGAFSSVWLAEDESDPVLAGPGDSPRGDSDSDGERKRKVVAVKMTPRAGADLERRRTTTSFVREVEVLRHISHPNITPLLTHLTTPTHHVLVLPYIPGGDLLGLVNSDEAHGALDENTLRRIWCELCKAVGWMHGVGLVHRDVKLENVLLTRAISPTVPPQPPALNPPPLIKLTDFGLSRFIDPDAPLLSTRCGSEAYAAPELVIGGRRYDGRETDAWACGVVLFALVGRGLPFGEGVKGGRRRMKIRGDEGDGQGREEGDGMKEGERRSWLMRIARGEYEWPAVALPEKGTEKGQDRNTGKETEPDGELKGPMLVGSGGARRIVGRLLVRDPGKRARIKELWGDEWMDGLSGIEGEEGKVEVQEGSGEMEEEEERIKKGENLKDEDGNEKVVVRIGEGKLVDRDGIDRIACEEVL